MENITNYSTQIWTVVVQYAPKIIGALLVFVFGLWLTNIVGRQTGRAMGKRKLDVSLQSFLSSLVSVILKVLLLVTVAGMLGIQTTSFVAILGAAGLAVGLALQGSLANFAGGVLMLVFKPYKVGDLVESGGQFGEVKEIQIFNTVLLSPENKTVILPNGAVSNGTIINFSRHGNLRVDIAIAVAPDNDLAKVRQVIGMVFSSNPKVLKDPAPSVNVLKMGDGMITLAVRPYATPADYWDVFFGVQEQIKTAFEANHISSPIPTRMIINKTS
jgi:small conductance mechanosensitive channel